MLRDCCRDELFCASHCSFECEAVCQAGGDRGGVSASRPMCGYPTREGRREFNDVSCDEKEIDRTLSGEMTAF